MSRKSGFYAVYFVEESRVEIFREWDAALQAMRGHPNLNKKVYSVEEAKAWVSGISEKDIARAILYSTSLNGKF